MHRKTALSLALVALLASAACGNDDPPSSATTTPGASPTAATGEPLEFMQAQAVPGDPVTGQAGIDAAVKRINDAGGVGGRMLKATYCDASDANKVAKCAREAAANEKILAVVANTDYFGTFNATAIKAGLPSVGTNLFTQADYNCSVCFAQTAGAVGGTGGSVAVAVDVLKAKKLGLAYIDVPAGQGLAPLVNGGILGPRKLKLAASVPIPLTATDYGPVIAALPSDIDALITATNAAATAKVAIQARKSGKTYPLVLPEASISRSDIASLIGDLATKTYVASMIKLSGPGYEKYQADMKAINKAGTAEDSGQASTGWMAVNLFADMVQKAGPASVTRASLLAALRSTSNYDTGGMTPPLDFTKKQTALGGALPNILNSNVVAYEFDPATKRLTQVGDGAFIDIFAAPTS